MNRSVVIVGAGHAGGALAAQLRQFGYLGSITLVGQEMHHPYQRPPLSKGWLKGEVDADSLALRQPGFYDEANVVLRVGVKVISIDRLGRRLQLSNGSQISYDVLILCTGARPVRLKVPGVSAAGIQTFRTAADAEALRTALRPGRGVVVVGGGFIGLEIAASAVSLGATVTVVEREERLLSRSGGVTIADCLKRAHERRGARIVVNAEVTGFDSVGGAVSAVRFADGSRQACEVVVIGVGVIPRIELAEGSGLACQRGVLVNDFAQTSDPDIYAVGDCTRRPSPLYDRKVCLESVPSALEQVRQAAAHLTNRPAPPPEVPWNWSDQYDLKLQVAGLPFDSDRLVVRGDPSTERFAVFHLLADRVRQVEAVNAAPEFIVGKALILNGKCVSAKKLADIAVSMKDVSS